MAAFHAVARHGSFTKAAVSLFESRSAVSIQMTKLEVTLGRRLFDRTTRNFVLTEAAEVLQRYISKI